MVPVSLGLPGTGAVAPGTHLCALYRGPDERDALLFPFLEEGLGSGDDCFCLVDDLEVGSVLDRLLDHADAEGVERLDLRVDRATDIYLQSAEFSADRMTAFLEENVATVATDPGRLVRGAGEMSWVLADPPGADELFVYESAINRVVKGAPALFMCLYDLDLFSTEMLVEVLRTHPKLLLDGSVRENLHYQPPEVYASGEGLGPGRQSRAELAALALKQRVPGH
jgi:hypothetical protein